MPSTKIPTDGAIAAALEILGQPYKAWYELPIERSMVLCPPESKERLACIEEVYRVANVIDKHVSITELIGNESEGFVGSVFYNSHGREAWHAVETNTAVTHSREGFGDEPKGAIAACRSAEWRPIHRNEAP